MLQRIREAFGDEPSELLAGTIEIDQMFGGGRQSNRHKGDRARYTAEHHHGKKPVVAAVELCGKVVAKPIPSTDDNTLTRFVEANVKHGSRVITDHHGGYTDLIESFRHRTVKHSVGEYVRYVDVHTNTVESLWSMFKRGFVGTYHRMSFKHLHRYVNESAGRKNIRELDTPDQVVGIVRGMIGKPMRYHELTG